MKAIYISSPYRPTAENPKLAAMQVAHNIDLVRKACRHVAENGDIPIAPHLYFTQFLDDNEKEERALGMTMGIGILDYCDELWVVTDSVISEGMINEIEAAVSLEIPVRMFDSEFHENYHIKDLVKSIQTVLDDDDEDYEDPVLKDDDPEDMGDSREVLHYVRDLHTAISCMAEMLTEFFDNDDKDSMKIEIVKNGRGLGDDEEREVKTNGRR